MFQSGQTFGNSVFVNIFFLLGRHDPLVAAIVDLRSKYPKKFLFELACDAFSFCFSYLLSRKSVSNLSC